MSDVTMTTEGPTPTHAARASTPTLRTVAAIPLALVWALAGAGCGGGDGGEAATEEETSGGEAAPDTDEGSTTDDAGTDTTAAEPAGVDTDAAEAADANQADGTDEEPTAEEGAEETATVEEEPEEDPRVVWRRSVRRGRRIYDRVCETCHPGGEEDLGPRIIGKRFSTARMRRQIRQGVGRMRPIGPSKLPERYMDDLFAYLSTIRAVRGVSRP